MPLAPPPPWLQTLLLVVGIAVLAVAAAVVLGLILIVCFRGSQAVAHNEEMEISR